MAAHASSARAAVAAGYRYAEAVLSPLTAVAALRAYPAFLRDRRRYRELAGADALALRDDWPVLLDRTTETAFEPHYTFQDGWAARLVAEHRPARHVDVGSRVSYVVGLSAWVPVMFVDIRPLTIDLDGLDSIAGSLLALPFEDASLESVSCLHVAEHVGLGRYGDPLDPQGTVKAANELQRVVAPGGRLLFSLPVGRPRTQFNAHRVHDPRAIPALFDELRLERFDGVDDGGELRPAIEPDELADCAWGCGLYAFVRD